LITTDIKISLNTVGM